MIVEATGFFEASDYTGGVATALIAIRGAKSKQKVSMKTEVDKIEFSGRGDALERLKSVENDLRAVSRLTGEVLWAESDTPVTVEVELAPTPA